MRKRQRRLDGPRNVTHRTPESAVLNAFDECGRRPFSAIITAMAARKGAVSEWLSHLSDEEIEDYVSGAADPDEKSAIEQHITACTECRDRLKEALRRSA